MKTSFDQLDRCCLTLERSLKNMTACEPESIDYEVARNAVIKSFELTLETAGKLLKKALKLYTGAPRKVDELTYKDTLRHAALHGLLTQEELTRWFAYRDNRNSTAYDYGQEFAEKTLTVITDFEKDARQLYQRLVEKHGSENG
jgi:nucleotidyltransferase substrate binding protein (TIGR01987 family)